MAEWRFLLFTIIVTVKSPIWNVIRIVSPPFGDVTNRLPFVQRPVFTVLQFSTSCNICFIWPRRAQQCRVRTQSAAVLSSLAPHDSKARLRAVTSIVGIRGEATYTAPDCAARAALRATDCQCKRGRGARPLVLSLGGLRGILSFEKESIPLYPCSAKRCSPRGTSAAASFALVRKRGKGNKKPPPGEARASCCVVCVFLGGRKSHRGELPFASIKIPVNLG